MERPESTMVADCRVKTATSLGLILSVKSRNDDLGLHGGVTHRHHRDRQVPHLAEAPHHQPAGCRPPASPSIRVPVWSRTLYSNVVAISPSSCRKPALICPPLARANPLVELQPVQVVPEVLFAPAAVHGHALGDRRAGVTSSGQALVHGLHAELTAGLHQRVDLVGLAPRMRFWMAGVQTRTSAARTGPSPSAVGPAAGSRPPAATNPAGSGSGPAGPGGRRR